MSLASQSAGKKVRFPVTLTAAVALVSDSPFVSEMLLIVGREMLAEQCIPPSLSLSPAKKAEAK